MTKSRSLVMSIICIAAVQLACSGSSSQTKDDVTHETTTEPTTAIEPSEQPGTTEPSTTAPQPAKSADATEAGPDFADPDAEGEEFFETWFKVTGQVDAEQVKGVIGRNKDSIYECYSQQLADHPGLAGRVLISITSNGAGQVASAVVRKSTLQNKLLEACMTKTIRGWKMPQSRDGGLVMVTYPFLLPP